MDNEIVKNQIAESSSVDANDNFEMRNISQLGGTNNDEHDMRMLGRTQVLNVRTAGIAKESKTLTALQRNFRFISTLGFACTLMSTWEIALMWVLLVRCATVTC